MYVWTGIDVERQLTAVKQRAWKINDALVFENFCTTLPLHISLKMSFWVDGAIVNEVMNTIEKYYATIEPFEISLKGIEDEGCIVWIRMDECAELNRVHDDLNRILSERYGVGLHEYDCDYKFHTTLFMGREEEKIHAAYAQIKDEPLPQKLVANRFVIGGSESGELGTYAVFRTLVQGE